MTPQENDALRNLLSQLVQIRGIAKDPDAEQMISRAIAQQPDAAYLLVQRALILEQALDAAKAQISRLEQQVAQGAPRGGSFLNDNAWGNSAGMGAPAAPRPHTEYSVTGQPLQASPNLYPNMPAGMPYANNPGMAASPPGRSRMFGGAGTSMLGTLAATAAGVAGGAFLFHGIGNLLDNHQGHGANPLADSSSGFQSDNGTDTGADSQSLSSDVSERLGGIDNTESIDNSFSDTGDAGDWSQDSGGDDYS